MSESRSPQPGDVLEITGHRVGDAPRSGEILEVLGESAQPHLRVRWEDGHESIFYPSSDAVIRPGRPLGQTEDVAAGELVRELDRSGISYELLPHTTSMTADDEASALGVPHEQVAKTLVLTTETGHVRAVLPASERLDLHKVRALIGDGKTTRLATEEELAASYPMFELGAVPPFGGPADERTIVDRRLAAQESIVIEAGSHRESMRIRTQDLLSLTGEALADICAD